MTDIGVRPDQVVDEFLYARLNGDATLRSILNVPTQATRVANMVAPKEWGDGPMVVFHQALPMRTVRGFGPTARLLDDGEYLVRVIGRPKDWGTISSAANRLDALLEGATGTTAGGVVITCQRIESYRLVENDTPEGQEPRAVWMHVGASWRTQAG